MDKSDTKSREKIRTKIGQATITTTAFGLGGGKLVVVGGGALAVAGLVAFYAIKRYRRNKGGCTTKTSKECFFKCLPKKDEDSGGLHSLLETSSSSPLDSSSKSSGHKTSNMSTVVATQEMKNFTVLEITLENALHLEEDPKVDLQMQSAKGDTEEVARPAEDNTEERTYYMNKNDVIFNNTDAQELKTTQDKRTEEKIRELEITGEEVRSYRFFVRILFVMLLLLLFYRRFPLLLVMLLLHLFTCSGRFKALL